MAERFTGARREEYFRVLRETGNARAAADAAGIDKRTVERRRRKDPVLARELDEAAAEADRRLAGQDNATGEEGRGVRGDPFEVLRRGSHGRLQLVAAGARRWTGRIENRFLALLRRTGNFSASARAVGFSDNHVWERRRNWPGFARRIDEVLEEAEIVLEFRLARQANDVAPAAADETAGECDAPAPKFDPELALKFLKWREEKRRGVGKRRGRHPIRPTIEAVTDKIVRKVGAIKRHRARYGPEGDGRRAEGDGHKGGQEDDHG